MTTSSNRKFIYAQVDDTFVVWLAEANRFLQLKEPAFFVFGQWAQNTSLPEISAYCAVRYELPDKEAERFVAEIIGETEQLISSEHRAQGAGRRAQGTEHRAQGTGHRAQGSKSDIEFHRKDAETQSQDYTFLSEIHCSFPGKEIYFIYENEEVEELIRPLFSQFEIKSAGYRAQGAGLRAQGTGRRAQGEGLRARGSGLRAQGTEQFEKDGQLNYFVELFRERNKYCFRVNGADVQGFDTDHPEHFLGAVMLEFLNILHDKTSEDWMGVFHASAVSSEDQALLFIGDPGAGKSTLATLMVANGCKMVSDDFVPVDKGNSAVYPLPAAVSVKKGSVPVLEKSFPELIRLEKENEEESELFLPLPEDKLEKTSVKAKALIFVKYDPDSPFRLVKESNLAMMNSLLKQSWIPGRPEVIGKFLDWYFALPVYTLAYSDPNMVIKGMIELMRELGNEGVRERGSD